MVYTLLCRLHIRTETYREFAYKSSIILSWVNYFLHLLVPDSKLKFQQISWNQDKQDTQKIGFSFKTRKECNI